MLLDGVGAKMGMLPESLAKERAVGRLQRETFRRAVKAGVTMTFGADAGVYPHGDNVSRLEHVDFVMKAGVVNRQDGKPVAR